MQRRSRFGLRLLPWLAVSAAAGLALTTSGTAAAAQARLLVKFAPGASSQARSNALAASGARELRQIPDLGVQAIAAPTAGAATALARLNSTPSVEFAEPDAVLEPQDQLPSDPSFPQTFAVGGGAWGWYSTHTTQAWDITKGDPSVVIAVVDTGLKTGGLSDFDGQVVSGWNVLTGTSDTATNAGNHGTYVAGVAGLALDHGTGNAGYCPRCRIMPVLVGTDSGASFANLAAGITWAADHGARVVNLSWASTTDSSTIQSAINYAHSRGVLIVAAAGNTNCDC